MRSGTVSVTRAPSEAFPLGEAVAALRALTDEGGAPRSESLSTIAASGSYTIKCEAVAALRAVTDEGRYLLRHPHTPLSKFFRSIT